MPSTSVDSRSVNPHGSIDTSLDGENPHLAAVVHRNIESLVEFRRREEAGRGPQERAAEAITRLAGSVAFVYVHLVLFGSWLVINSGAVPGIRPFDPFPFVMLAMFASVEAIFISTFVLIGQNRMSALSDQRAELDLHISLLAEHEVTRLVQMVDGISERLGVPTPPAHELHELKQDVRPEVVLEELEAVDTAEKKAPTSPSNGQRREHTGK